jgi:hypothetical protein
MWRGYRAPCELNSPEEALLHLLPLGVSSVTIRCNGMPCYVRENRAYIRWRKNLESPSHSWEIPVGNSLSDLYDCLLPTPEPIQRVFYIDGCFICIAERHVYSFQDTHDEPFCHAVYRFETPIREVRACDIAHKLVILLKNGEIYLLVESQIVKLQIEPVVALFLLDHDKLFLLFDTGKIGFEKV